MSRFLKGCILAAGLLPVAGVFAETAGNAPQGTICPHCGHVYTAPHETDLAAGGFAEGPQASSNDWKSTVYGGFAAKSGNAVETSYNYGGEFEKRAAETYRYKLKADGRYSKTEEQVTASKSETSGEMRRMLNERWFAYGTLSALHDNLRDLSYRAKAGPGLGYYFVDTETLVADFSSGPLYVREKTSGGSSGYLAWRAAQWFDWHINSTFRWWISTEAVMETADMAAYTVAFKTGVDSKISDHLSLIVVVADDYDSMPEKKGDIKKNDFEISTGVRYTF